MNILHVKKVIHHNKFNNTVNCMVPTPLFRRTTVPKRRSVKKLNMPFENVSQYKPLALEEPVGVLDSDASNLCMGEGLWVRRSSPRLVGNLCPEPPVWRSLMTRKVARTTLKMCKEGRVKSPSSRHAPTQDFY